MLNPMFLFLNIRQKYIILPAPEELTALQMCFFKAGILKGFGDNASHLSQGD